MSRIFIEGVDCSGKTTFVNDQANYPDYPRLKPQEFKNERKSWEMVWLELKQNKIFNGENVLIDRSFVSIYVYSDINLELFVRFVDNNNLLRIDDEIKLLDVDYSSYSRNAIDKAVKKELDEYDILPIEKFLFYKKRYWEVLSHPYFIKNFCFGFYRNQ